MRKHLKLPERPGHLDFYSKIKISTASQILAQMWNLHLIFYFIVMDILDGDVEPY